jgi:hypothetical protein
MKTWLLKSFALARTTQQDSMYFNFGNFWLIKKKKTLVISVPMQTGWKLYRQQGIHRNISCSL